MPQILSTYHVNILGSGQTVDFVALTRDEAGRIALYPCSKQGKITADAQPVKPAGQIDIDGDRQPDAIDLTESARTNTLVSRTRYETVFGNRYEMDFFDPSGTPDLNGDGMPDLLSYDLDDYLLSRLGTAASYIVTSALTPTWVPDKK